VADDWSVCVGLRNCRGVNFWGLQDQPMLESGSVLRAHRCERTRENNNVNYISNQSTRC